MEKEEPEFELAPLQAPLEMALVDLLDQVPSDSQQIGNGLQGGDLAQLDDVAREGPQMALFPLGEGDRLSPGLSTSPTVLAMTMQNHKLGSPPNG